MRRLDRIDHLRMVIEGACGGADAGHQVGLVRDEELRPEERARRESVGVARERDFVVADAERWEIRKLAVELCLIQRVGAGRIVGVRHSQTPLADVSQIWIERHARHEPSVADWIVDDSRIRNDCKEVEQAEAEERTQIRVVEHPGRRRGPAPDADAQVHGFENMIGSHGQLRVGRKRAALREVHSLEARVADRHRRGDDERRTLRRNHDLPWPLVSGEGFVIRGAERCHAGRVRAVGTARQIAQRDLSVLLQAREGMAASLRAKVRLLRDQQREGANKHQRAARRRHSSPSVANCQ